MTEKTKIQHLQDGILLGALEAGGVADASRHDLAAVIVLNEEVSISNCELIFGFKGQCALKSYNFYRSSIQEILVKGLPHSRFPGRCGMWVQGFLGGVACGWLAQDLLVWVAEWMLLQVLQ